MARIAVNKVDLFYEDTGGTGEPILFSHGLLWNTSLFAPQVAALRERYRCIAYDHRGQGHSEVTPLVTYLGQYIHGHFAAEQQMFVQ